MRALGLAAFLCSLTAFGQTELPDIDVATPPPTEKRAEPPPNTDHFSRNKRLISELVLGSTFELVPLGLSLAACRLTTTSAGCSAVFPFIALASVALGPGLGVILGGHLYETSASGSAVSLGVFTGMLLFAPASIILALPGFDRRPAGIIVALMLLTLGPVGGAMIGYELTIHAEGEPVALKLHFSPGAIAGVF